MPKLTIMVGLPGSGKSTIAHNYGEVVSTDAVREELLGDVSNQSNGDMIFNEAFSRVHKLLNSNVDAVFDATNISKKRRSKLFREFKEADNIIAVFVNTDINECLKRNNSRDRKVPEEVIYRMLRSLDVPTVEEGFSEIIFR